jgi:hypothetical protein
MKPLIFTHRAFLNKPGFHSNASLSADITESEYGEGFYGTYKISDCSRTIELSIDLDTEDDLNNSIFKMDCLILAAEKFKEALVELKPKIIKAEKETIERDRIRKEKKDADTK